MKDFQEWKLMRHYKVKWDQKNMDYNGVKEVIKMVREDGEEIETDSEQLEEALAKMSERTLYVQEHQKRTQALFCKWANNSIKNNNLWPDIAQEIDDMIGWIFANKNQFPNYRAHIDQWSELKDIAIQRSYIKEFLQKCTGNPDICDDAGNCFNLQHMLGDYTFESAQAKSGICVVTMKYRRF